MSDGPLFIICAVRTVMGDDLVVPGSVEQVCSHCNANIWLAPSGRMLQAEKDALLVCHDCGLAKIEQGATVGDVTETQIREVLDVLRREFL